MKSLIIGIIFLSSIVSAFPAGQTTDADLVKQADAYAARQDYKNAAARYEKAAHHNYAPAEYKLGKAYCAGQGVPTNFTLGKQWLKRAAGHGSKDAKYALEDLQKLEQIGGIELH
jgi:TPR repeat protein